MAKIKYADQFIPNFGRDWISLPTDEEAKNFTNDQLIAMMSEWSAFDEAAKKNPVGDGWRLPSWKIVQENWAKYNIFVMLGGNASGKSVFGSRLVLSMAAMIPEASIACFSPSAETSIADQQRLVFDALPDSLKNLPTKKGQHWNLSFSSKNGFTDSVCILPPLPGYRYGSTIRFYNFNQWAQSQDFIEGKRFHTIWGDERMPLGLLNTLRLGRIGAYHGRILLTYTVVDGWNDTIEKILAKTVTLKKRYCDHPKIKQDLPIIQESKSIDSTLILYSWTRDNEFADYAEFLKLNASEPREVILARGFGVPTKGTSSAFPNFDKEINVVKHEDLPWLKEPKPNARGQITPYKVTRYMSIDPGGSKNWFMLWIAIDAAGTWWVYREWPDESLGEWALPGDKNGPATKSLGYGIKDYVELIKNMEGDEQIFERFIDPRMGAAEKQGMDGATTIISELDDAGIVCIPAPAASSDANKGEIEDGISLLAGLLRYKTTEPISAMNAPHLYVSDRCQNFIYSMSEYTGKLGTHEATKDPIDCARFMIKGSCEFIDTTAKDNSRTGVY